MTSRALGGLIRQSSGDLKRLLRDLVRTDSVSAPPGGNESAAQLVLQNFFRDRGITADLYATEFIVRSGHPAVRSGRSYRGRKNLSVRLGGSGRGKSLLLNGHMDTVPQGAGKWMRSPWSGAFHQGAIHGLGSFDMKGGVVANAAVICAMHRAGIRPGGDVLFESVIDEEWGGGGGTIAARLRDGSPDACVIPEGTQLELYRATRGGMVVDLKISIGEDLNYFSRDKVPSLASGLRRLLGWVEGVARKRSQNCHSDAYADFPDPVPVQILAVEANGLSTLFPLSVPLSATVRVYFQFLPEESVQVEAAVIEKSLRNFEGNDSFFSFHPVEWQLPIGPPLEGTTLRVDHEWTQCLSSSSKGVTGASPVVTGAPYPCDAGLMQRHFGIPTLIFGPSGGGAHSPNEYVDFDSVLTTADVLLEATLNWTGA